MGISARQGGRGCRLSLPGGQCPHLCAANGGGAGQPAFVPRLANTAGAGGSMGSGRVIVREDSYGKQYVLWRGASFGKRRAAGANWVRGGPALHLCRAKGAGGFLWAAIRSIVRGFFWEVTRRRREEGAGSACRASPLLCALAAYAAGGGPARVCAAPRQYGGRGGFLWEVTLYQEKFARQGSGF